MEVAMSFFKRLFGFGNRGASGSFSGEMREFNGHVIHAEPVKDNGQWRLAGRITKDEDGVVKEHKFVRADVFSSRDEAVDFTFRKGELIISQLGKTMFS
jgi:hypothetical protein